MQGPGTNGKKNNNKKKPTSFKEGSTKLTLG